jgi:hypothetical protein
LAASATAYEFRAVAKAWTNCSWNDDACALSPWKVLAYPENIDATAAETSSAPAANTPAVGAAAAEFAEVNVEPIFAISFAAAANASGTATVTTSKTPLRQLAREPRRDPTGGPKPKLLARRPGPEKRKEKKNAKTLWEKPSGKP